MVGATAQLAAFGAADQYLSAQPQITYFKQIWRRYTQFAMESVNRDFVGDAAFGRQATVELGSAAADLVTEVWLQVKLPALANLNHITNATPLASAPVVHYARNTAEDALKVIAYSCGAATDYVASFLATSAVQSVRLRTADLGVAVTLAASSTSALTLVPFGVGAGGQSTITLTGSGASYSSAALTPGVAYALCFGGDVAARDALVMLKQTTGALSVTFEVAGADPELTYVSQVSAVVSAASAASVAQTVLKAKWCNSVGHALISGVEWQIGGSKIDRHTAEHLDMWCELTEREEKRAGYSDMIGRYDAYDINHDATSSGAERYLFVPMRFSFNTSPGNALPIVALSAHNVKLNFEFRSFLELIKSNVSLTNVVSEPAMECKCFATYIFLSPDERRRFTDMPHEYLIETLQAQPENVTAPASLNGVVNRKIRLNFSHPIKEIMFAYQAATNTQKDTRLGNNWFDYDIPGYASEEVFDEANIQFNGHDRFVKRPAKYWRLAVPYTHHTRIPTKKVHCYSFALHPESWKNPSGAANFSRIDNADLSLTLNPNLLAGRIRIHAVGYNVLRIVGGQGGLVFAN